MKSIRIFFYTLTVSMIFHSSVSARENLTSFTATPPSSVSTPLKTSRFVSFNSVINRKKVSLNWIVSNNQEIELFEVQRSKDGKAFETAALVFGTDNAGMDNYYFFEKMKRSKIYYRVKTVAKDGSVNYSQIIIAGSI